MRKCVHEKVETAVWRIGAGDVMAWFGRASWETSDATVCLDCGHWLPLGPANDGGEFAEQVAVEKDAARLASYDLAGRKPIGPCMFSLPFEQCTACQELHLAYVIATHDEGEGHGA